MYQAYSRFWGTGGAAMLCKSGEQCACRYSHTHHTDICIDPWDTEVKETGAVFDGINLSF